MGFPIATPRAVERARAHIVTVDPSFAETIRQAGPLRFPPPTSDHLAYLVRAIVYQQLAGAAARTIHGRLVGRLGEGLSAPALLHLTEEEYRAAGISRNKYLAIQDLAGAVLGGRLAVDRGLERLGDEEIIERLSAVRGVGRWTAQMFLMTQLRRLDVWPTGDLGVRNGYGVIHGGPRPTPAALEAAGETLRPFRSVAATYCWRAVALHRDGVLVGAPPSG